MIKKSDSLHFAWSYFFIVQENKSVKMIDNFSVILVEPMYQRNIGSVARVMKNLGFSKLVMINPPEIDGEARAMAMHGIDILKNGLILKDFNDIKEKFDFLVATTAKIAGDKNTLRTPIFPEQLNNAINVKGNIGLVFGRENSGLNNKEIRMCDLLVSIPTDASYPTLNLSHSVGIILYEISKMCRKEMKLKKFKKLSKVEKDILLEKFDNLVDKLYKNDFEKRLVKKTFRQLIGRSFMSGREATTLIGLFRKAGEKVG